jgi:hypothetical protein
MYNEFLKLNSTKTSKLKNGQVFWTGTSPKITDSK